MLTVVCFLWRSESRASPVYAADHVNHLKRAFAPRLPAHRFVCATDMPEDLDAGIDVAPLDLAMPRDRRFLKLSLFRRDAGRIFGGERLLFSDLDVTPVGDLSPLVDRDEDFVIWRDPLFGREGHEKTHLYNSSLILMDAGCRPEVYETFDLASSPAATRASGLVGSDQAWIGMTLGPDEAVWTQEDGVFGFKHDLGGKMSDPRSGWEWPGGARLIVSHGRPKPWDLDADHPLRLAYED